MISYMLPCLNQMQALSVLAPYVWSGLVVCPPWHQIGLQFFISSYQASRTLRSHPCLHPPPPLPHQAHSHRPLHHVPPG